MEEFMDLADVWCDDQTFDVNHFDDLDVTEAKDGLCYDSVKSKPRVDLLHSLIDTPVGGYLGLDWMEQSNLMQYLQTPAVDDGLVTTGLQDDGLPIHVSALAVEEETEPQDSSAAFLQSLLQEQEHLMALPLVKDEPSDIPLATVDHHTVESLVVESPVSTAPSSPEAEVVPEIDFSITLDLEDVLVGEKVEFVQAPLSQDDVESLLSSASQSPSSSTVDTSSLYSDDCSLIYTSNLYEVLSNEKKKSRPTPYSKPRSTSKNTKSKGRKQTASISPNPSELELELMSKKDRKKLQNKNAAIRYRLKKKEESSIKRTVEEELETINQSLVEKVEELNREIKYMKGLISDVRKARGLPPLVC